MEYIQGFKMENQRGKIKQWESLLGKGRGHRQSRFVNMKLGRPSAVLMQVFIYVGVREKHAANTEKSLLIISGHIPCESNSSWMRQPTEDEVRQEI